MARWVRRLAVPIIVGWIALIAVLSVTVPQLEVVGEMQAVSMSPKDAPSLTAMMRVGKVFQEFDSDSSAMIVLEGDHATGCGSASVLPRHGRQAAGRHQARPAHPGLLGRPADKVRSAERRWQGHIRAGVSRREHGRSARQR